MLSTWCHWNFQKILAEWVDWLDITTSTVKVPALSKGSIGKEILPRWHSFEWATVPQPCRRRSWHQASTLWGVQVLRPGCHYGKTAFACKSQGHIKLRNSLTKHPNSGTEVQVAVCPGWRQFFVFFWSNKSKSNWAGMSQTECFNWFLRDGRRKRKPGVEKF